MHTGVSEKNNTKRLQVCRAGTLQTRVMELQKKIKRNNLILTKADPRNSIVVMDKGDYMGRDHTEE